MDSAILSLLGAFVLSIIGLFVFVWSLRQGLLVENPVAASVIFAPGEIGKVDDPALSANAQHSMQGAAGAPEAASAASATSRRRRGWNSGQPCRQPPWPGSIRSPDSRTSTPCPTITSPITTNPGRATAEVATIS